MLDAKHYPARVSFSSPPSKVIHAARKLTRPDRSVASDWWWLTACGRLLLGAVDLDAATTCQACRRQFPK